MRRIALIALLALFAPEARAQILKVPNGGLKAKHDPVVLVGASIGLFNLQGIFDGSTQTAWDFSQTIEFAGSLEYALSKGTSFGVTASYAHVPLLYVDTLHASLSAIQSGCCDAHANVYTMGAQLSVGGGGEPGFHQLVVLNAGVIAFEKFTLDRGGQQQPPSRNVDPRIGIGYGFAYGFGGRSEAFLVQEYGVALHESTGLTGNDRRQYEQRTTRLGFKLGLGGR